VELAEAEAIYDAGRDVVVEVLLRMDRQIQELSETVARQGERIAQLERRLNRSSRNSSQPPSVDPPGTVPKRGKDSSGRRQGGQAGHEGKGRPLLPAWAVDDVVDHWPDRCDCGHVFAADELVAAGDPVRHQVEELPPITVTVTEHRCQRVRCPGCGRRRRAQLPREVPGVRSDHGFRRRSRRCRCATESAAATSSSCASSCLARGSAAARSTRSCAVSLMR
jgi:hypothetical protein